MQIIVAERRRGESEPNYLPDLKRDLLAVICKYVQVDPEMLSVQFEQKGDDISVLELNVTLPEGDEGTKKDETAKRVVLVTDNNTAGYPAVFLLFIPGDSTDLNTGNHLCQSSLQQWFTPAVQQFRLFG